MKLPMMSARAVAAARSRQLIRRQQRKKYLSIALIALAAVMLLTGLQAMMYYTRYIPRVNTLNDQMTAFMTEKAENIVLIDIQEKFRSLVESLRSEEVHARQVLSIFELLVKHFRQTPVQTAEEVRVALLKLGEELQQQGQTQGNTLLSTAGNDVNSLATRLNDLKDIYTIEFDQLQSDLEYPPWYLWPTGSAIRYKTGYLSAVTYNRAMYLSQIGETGTARVLLTGLYSSADNEQLRGLVFYGLGRLQWELFTITNEPENYFQAVKYIRQSIQTDPEMDLSKRVFDFMMSLSQGDSAPRAGEGDPSNPSEGEAASVSETTPMF